MRVYGTEVCVLLVILLSGATALPDRENLIKICGNRKTTEGVLETLLAPSLLRCGTYCMNVPQCYSANYKRSSQECVLSSNFDDGNCGLLTSEDGVKYLELSSPCKNNGTWDRPNKVCVCVTPYVGKTCHRLPRDCTEWKTTPLFEQVPVKPLKSDTIYDVFCAGPRIIFFDNNFQLSGLDYNRDWETYKTGFHGGSFRGIWSGLEDAYQLLRHGRYDLRIRIYDSSVPIQSFLFYKNFKLGPESDNYAMYYDSFEKCPNYKPSYSKCFDPEDAFSGHGDPLKNMNGSGFGTSDRDRFGCAASYSYAWWYNTNCAYPVADMNIVPPRVKWPMVSGTPLELKFLEGHLELQYFYDTE